MKMKLSWGLGITLLFVSVACWILFGAIIAADISVSLFKILGMCFTFGIGGLSLILGIVFLIDSESGCGLPANEDNLIDNGYYQVLWQDEAEDGGWLALLTYLGTGEVMFVQLKEQVPENYTYFVVKRQETPVDGEQKKTVRFEQWEPVDR